MSCCSASRSNDSSLSKSGKDRGTVKLDLTVSESGNVAAVKVIAGHPMLVSSAVDAAKKWKYKPFESGGKRPLPIAKQIKMDYDTTQVNDESGEG